jgi:ketosteroid isomerase-like protein
MLRILSLLLVFALMIVGTSARADQAEKIAVEKAYDQHYQALADRDLDKVLSFFDPSYELIDAQGKRIKYSQIVALFKHHFKITRTNNGVFTLKDVRVNGDKIEAYIEDEYRYEIYKEEYSEWVVMLATSKFEAVLQKKGGKLKLMKEKVLRTHRQMDPQWVAAYIKQWNDIKAMNMPCTFSSNGCP